MKAKQNWQLIGRFVGTCIKLFTLISRTFEKAGVGLEAIEWVVDQGKDFVAAKLTEIAEEYNRQNPATIIHIDRSVALVYPDWVKEPLYPEMEKKGPAEIDIAANCIQWLHDDQKGGKCATGHVIHNYLVANDLIDSCYGLLELLAIQKKGIIFFRKHFKGKAIVGWKGTVQSRAVDGSLYIPCLYEDGGTVVLSWHWLGAYFSDSYPGLRLAS